MPLKIGTKKDLVDFLAEELYVREYGNESEGRAYWRKMTKGRHRWKAEATHIVNRLIVKKQR